MTAATLPHHAYPIRYEIKTEACVEKKNALLTMKGKIGVWIDTKLTFATHLMKKNNLRTIKNYAKRKRPNSIDIHS